MQRAVLLCRQSAGDSSPPKDTGVSGQWAVGSGQFSVQAKFPSEGKAPDEPK